LNLQVANRDSARCSFPPSMENPGEGIGIW
jgi:hypothetical protein